MGASKENCDSQDEDRRQRIALIRANLMHTVAALGREKDYQTAFQWRKFIAEQDRLGWPDVK